MSYIRSHEVNFEKTVSFDIDIKEVFEELDQFEQQDFIGDVLSSMYGPEKINLILRSINPYEMETLQKEISNIRARI